MNCHIFLTTNYDVTFTTEVALKALSIEMDLSENKELSLGGRREISAPHPVMKSN
jgi:hypothetical protein